MIARHSRYLNYARRADTYGLPSNPVEGTTKRREPPPAVLDFYEPEEIELLARTAADGRHRGPQPKGLAADEIEWRAREDAQDAELFRLAAYTGLRLGELIALRWEDVDLDTRRMVVHRAVSAGVEGPTKSWQARFLPIADPAAAALTRLRARGDYTSRDDYVLCSRLGRRLDPFGREAPFQGSPRRRRTTTAAVSCAASRRWESRRSACRRTVRAGVLGALADHHDRAVHACQGPSGGRRTGQLSVPGCHAERVAR